MAKETSDKAHQRKGKLIALAVVALLVGAPIGSYFYLRKGFEYRLESIQQLEEKSVSPQLLGAIEEHSPFNNNARLIHLPGRDLSVELDLVHQIDGQIADRERFEIVSFTNHDGREIERDISFVDQVIDSPLDIQFILIDTSNVVRATYPYSAGLGKEMIRHLSVVIPMPTRKPVNLNRSLEDK